LTGAAATGVGSTVFDATFFVAVFPFVDLDLDRAVSLDGAGFLDLSRPERLERFERLGRVGLTSFLASGAGLDFA